MASAALDTVANSAKNNTASFHQFPQPLLLSFLRSRNQKEETDRRTPRVGSECLDKNKSEA